MAASTRLQLNAARQACGSSITRLSHLQSKFFWGILIFQCEQLIKNICMCYQTEVKLCRLWFVIMMQWWWQMLMEHWAHARTRSMLISYLSLLHLWLLFYIQGSLYLPGSLPEPLSAPCILSSFLGKLGHLPNFLLFFKCLYLFGFTGARKFLFRE
jgi:hypothetical protein